MVREHPPSAVAMVLCAGCGDAVAADRSCPTCGKSNPLVSPAGGTDLIDDELLERVDVALAAAQLALANRVTTERVTEADQLAQASRVLCGRLQRQRMLLRARVAQRRELVPRVHQTLDRLDAALAHTGQRAEPGEAWSLCVRLPRDPSCSTVARRLLQEYAREQLSERKAEDTMLIVSELATNAFLHGSGSIIMTASRVDDRLRIDIRDEGHPDRIALVPEAKQGLGGRGLWLVEQLASDWGTTEGTGHVWAELALATPRPSAEMPPRDAKSAAHQDRLSSPVEN